MNFTAGCKDFRIDNNDDEDEEAQMDDRDEDEDDKLDFMDNSGKCWEFASKIEDEKHLKEWCQNKMGEMIVGKEEKLTRQFHCPNKECQFEAIFLKSCSIVYTRNKHKHNHGVNARVILLKKEEEKTNSPTKSTSEQNYVDRNGKLWPFRANIGTPISTDKLFTKFGFTNIQKNEKSLYLRCRKINCTAGGECPFTGIYLKSNGCLYTRGEHEHMKNGKIPKNIGDDYVDIFGKSWKFNKEIGKNVKSEIFLNKFGFNNTMKYGTGFYLLCRKRGPNGKCKFIGIYLNSNGCLYTRGKHNHVYIEKEPNPTVGDDYVDCHGKTWSFHSKIGKQHIPNEILLKKFGFTRICNSQQTLNLYCRKSTINDERCPIKGIYLKSNGCLYIRGKHEHK